MQLRFKIALYVFVPTAFLVMSSLIIIQQSVSRDLSQVRERSFQANAAILSEPVIEAFLEQDFARLDEFFLDLRQSPDILEGLAVDTNNRIISTDNPRLLGTQFAAQGSDWYSHDLVVGGRPRGTLWIRFDASETEAVLANVFTAGLLMMTMTLMGLAGIAYWIGTRIAGRISELANATVQITEGDYTTRTNADSNDELGQLASTFNQMAAQIENSVLELHRSEQRTSLALTAGGMGIWVFDTKTKSLFVDDRLADIYGCPESGDGISTEVLLNHIDSNDREARSLLVDQAIVADHVVQLEFRICLPDGETRWVRSQATALFAAVDDARVIGIDQDITSEKERFLEIEKLKNELERSNDELDDFAHIASHDLKEPLRGISNYAQFLKEDYGDELDETATQYVDRMMALSKNLSDMIADLLRMSRITRLDHSNQSAQFGPIVEEIKESLEFTFSEKNVRVVMADHLPDVKMDPAALRELLRNLMVNGIKYNESDERIIELGYDEAAQAYYVADNGIGIAENQLSEVFSPFRHLNAHDRFGRSTGLGATICQKLVNNAGGDIWIESEVGTGSKFWFTLPRV